MDIYIYIYIYIYTLAILLLIVYVYINTLSFGHNQTCNYCQGNYKNGTNPIRIDPHNYWDLSKT
jgi:hypothetical protein